MTDQNNIPRLKLSILILLLLAGIALHVMDFTAHKPGLELARGYADQWWLVLILILLQAVLFTFALPGSLFLWIVAPLYPPAMAAFILAAGGTLGGICAYLFSVRLGNEWIQRIEHSRIYTLLSRQNNFLTLFALRVLPAFPHSVINYSSGILKTRFSNFIPAAILGISIKSYIYARVIYNATTSSMDALFDISVYGPLILLSVLIMSAMLAAYYLSGNRQQKNP